MGPSPRSSAHRWQAKPVRAAELEPDVIEVDVFEMLDTNSDGFISLLDMEPLFAIASNCELRGTVEATSKRTRHPDSGFSLREFVAAFRKHNCVSKYYHAEAVSQMQPSGKLWAPRLRHRAQTVCDTRVLRKACTTGDLRSSPEQREAEPAAASSSTMPSSTARHQRRCSTMPADLSKSVASKGLGLQISKASMLPLEAFMPQSGELTVGAAPAHVMPYNPMTPPWKEWTGSPARTGLECRQRQSLAAASARMTNSRALRKTRQTFSEGVADLINYSPSREAQEQTYESFARDCNNHLSSAMQDSDRICSGSEREEPTIPGTDEAQEAKQLREALAEIEQLKQQVAVAAATKDAELQRMKDELVAAKDAELERMKDELAAAKEAQSTVESTPSKRCVRASVGGVGLEDPFHLGMTDSEDDNPEADEEEFDIMPAPPDSASWEWPMSRQEKKARVTLLERQMHALDRRSLMNECKRLSLAPAQNECMSDSD